MKLRKADSLFVPSRTCKRLLNAGLLMCVFTMSYLGSANSLGKDIEVRKNVLDKFFETNVTGALDIYGIDAEQGTVLLKADKKLLNYLDQGNIGYNESIGITSEEKERAQAYPRPETVLEEIKSIANDNSGVVKYVSLGTTHQGRDIASLEITKDFSVDKPVIVFNGLHHARELMTTQVVLSIARELAEGFKSGDSEITSFLNEYKVIVIPMLNPDGLAQVFDKNHYWRKNGWPNQYGRIVGVDLNRNYPVLFDSCGGSADRSRANTYRGETAASEPEVRAMIALMERHRPVANISYHSFSELILYPFGCEAKENTAANLFRNVANKLKSKIINDQGKVDKYGVGTTPELLYSADGMDIDTHWANYGVLSLTIEINGNDIRWFPEINEWVPKTIKRQREGWKELLRVASSSGLEFTANADYTYKIKNNDGSSFTEGYVVKPFVAKKDKVTRRILLPGSYIIEIFEGKNKIMTKSVNIGSKVLKLGRI
jgi:carboxypeptidase T